MEEAQLIHELKLLKDFYLLGRGELFLELLRLTAHMLDKPTTRTGTRGNFLTTIGCLAVYSDYKQHLSCLRSSDSQLFFFNMRTAHVQGINMFLDLQEGWQT